MTEKDLYRAARSLYELGRFRESQAIFETLLAAYPGREATKRELCRIEDRLQEQDHGCFNSLAMHESAAQKGDRRSRPWPVYHPSVAAGDLLLCGKAFSYSYCENTLTTNLWSVIALKGTGARPRYEAGCT